MHLSEEEARGVMNVSLPILNGHIIMDTDFFTSAGHEIRAGNNTTIVPEPDTRQQADELYVALSIGSNEKQDTAGMF
ncbi:MAG: hypothetical protein HKL85_03905 [Acidimicrobiaceae bacterium]|nr:hypothetical protein [Acidimicrobiaceae bacterium]